MVLPWLPLFTVFFSGMIFLASFGKSLGVRKAYVRILLKVFEFAQRIAKEERKKRRKSSDMDPLEYDDDDAKGDVGGEENNKNAVEARKKFLMRFGEKSRHNVISKKDNLVLTPDKPPVIMEEGHFGKEWSSQVLAGQKVCPESFRREFELEDILDYIKTGIGSIIEDEVTQRFVAEDLKSWNLLTRTSQSFQFVNVTLTVIYIIGCFVRYFVLLPMRTVIFFAGFIYMVAMTALIGLVPSDRVRRILYDFVAKVTFRIVVRSFSTVLTFHNRQWRPKSDGICVANHTSPIDVAILQCDRSYALVGQTQGGVFGMVQRCLGRATSHIWFERSEVKDRSLVTARLKSHVEDPTKLPILIFPEGTCINNTSVMQFKKGSFEIGGTVYPVAIKYDAKFGDAFWNSSQCGMMFYIFMMMTSWALVCDVHYLPPMTLGEGESSIDFANRVKAEIARKGGLVDLVWDGNLKRGSVKSEWKARQQKEFSKRLKVD